VASSRSISGLVRRLFGVATPSPVLNFLPTILFGILFGLAMDYTLFLASGMREAYAHGAPSKTAVVLDSAQDALS